MVSRRRPNTGRFSGLSRRRRAIGRPFTAGYRRTPSIPPRTTREPVSTGFKPTTRAFSSPRSYPRPSPGGSSPTSSTPSRPRRGSTARRFASRGRYGTRATPRSRRRPQTGRFSGLPRRRRVVGRPFTAGYRRPPPYLPEPRASPFQRASNRQRAHSCFNPLIPDPRPAARRPPPARRHVRAEVRQQAVSHRGPVESERRHARSAAPEQAASAALPAAGG